MAKPLVALAKKTMAMSEFLHGGVNTATKCDRPCVRCDRDCTFVLLIESAIAPELSD